MFTDKHCKIKAGPEIISVVIKIKLKCLSINIKNNEKSKKLF